MKFNLIRLSRLRRGMVIFFLAFAFVDLTLIDLAFPQLCNDDQVRLADGCPTEPAHWAKAGFNLSGGSGSQPVEDSKPDLADEDCFCCCSHIIPSYLIAIAPCETTLRLYTPSPEVLLTPPPQDTFHPPRLA